ncbi:hypothetical protein AAFF_G00323260 [Aldrovandia affinis]|uniref:Uncharacterized protein n=1 Tax=Aldrovandia affinis TaxID=143900 RepID=A0AAD7SMH1_9TELE|nr:hypothetical protein AAFF_G00323260 [Aldrovandia affinis]
MLINAPAAPYFTMSLPELWKMWKSSTLQPREGDLGRNNLAHTSLTAHVEAMQTQIDEVMQLVQEHVEPSALINVAPQFPAR